MKKVFIIVLIIAIVVVVWVLAKKQSTVSAPTTTQATQTTQTAPPESIPAMNNEPTSVGTSVSGSVTAPAPKNASVTIANFAFGPATVTIPVGGTVIWTQQDTAPHSIVSDSGAFSSSTLSAGQTYSHTFAKAGTYTYHCGIHPMMKGTVVVQ